MADVQIREDHRNSDPDSDPESSGWRYDSIPPCLAKYPLGYVAVDKPEADASPVESTADHFVETSIAPDTQPRGTANSGEGIHQKEMCEGHHDIPKMQVAKSSSFPAKGPGFLVVENTHGLGEEILLDIFKEYDDVINGDLMFESRELNATFILFSSLKRLCRALEDKDVLEATLGLVCLCTVLGPPDYIFQAPDKVAQSGGLHHDDNASTTDTRINHENTKSKTEGATVNAVPAKLSERTVDPRQTEHGHNRYVQEKGEPLMKATKSKFGQLWNTRQINEVDEGTNKPSLEPTVSYQEGVLKVLQHRIDRFEQAQDDLRNKLADVRNVKGGNSETWFSRGTAVTVMEGLQDAVEIVAVLLVVWITWTLATDYTKSTYFSELEKSMKLCALCSAAVPSDRDHNTEAMKAQLGNFVRLVRGFFVSR